jgi:hypothetical protein
VHNYAVASCICSSSQLLSFSLIPGAGITVSIQPRLKFSNPGGDVLKLESMKAGRKKAKRAVFVFIVINYFTKIDCKKIL